MIRPFRFVAGLHAEDKKLKYLESAESEPPAGT